MNKAETFRFTWMRSEAYDRVIIVHSFPFASLFSCSALSHSIPRLVTSKPQLAVLHCGLPSPPHHYL